MNTEQVIQEIEEYLGTADMKGATETIFRHLEGLPDFEKGEQIANVLYKQYTHFRADFLALFMERIIWKNPNLAQVNFTENFLFMLCVTTGSKDLFDCFVEKAVEPFLQDKNEDEKCDYYIELSSKAYNLTEDLFPHYEDRKKGMHYNSAFQTSEDNGNVLLIHREDYDVMQEIIVNYNQIIGRRDIIKAIEERISAVEMNRDDEDSVDL